MVKNPPALQEPQETQIQPLGWEDPLEETCQPIPYSCLENAMDREPWWDTVPVFTASDMTEATERACTPTYGRGALYFAAFNVTITPKQPHRIPSVLAP